MLEPESEGSAVALLAGQTPAPAGSACEEVGLEGSRLLLVLAVELDLEKYSLNQASGMVFLYS